ncbi:hypothetical protein FHX74_002118 [Friedmanniella endophytica]|uniref:Heavy metal transporter n=1 Tax=Microlunatus kandeliicorticis TaxID=1759536 RepID=A0A7W3ISL5_9ACTN|nr:hypothetical protein [Microlunatus kandeliicorticis]MBA8794499.1 hypothetical protein [Microlunatus kandeliicorticis]
MARTGRRVAPVVGVLAVVLLLAVGLVIGLRVTGASGPLPGEERCVARASGNSVAVDLDQAHYASIVVGLSVKRDLQPRAASIAMATVYQETGIRNLDYGDRDSVGLFQQRPSQGWGTEKQLMDPWYATGKFYSALVKIDGWEDADITTIAQRVQISAHPDAYRAHERDGRILASTLTGQSPAGFTCLVRGHAPGQPGQLRTAMTKTFGVRDFGAGPGAAPATGSRVSVTAPDTGDAWAYAQFAVANAKLYGISKVAVDGRSWTSDETTLPSWATDAEATRGVSGTTVVITLR